MNGIMRSMRWREFLCGSICGEGAQAEAKTGYDRGCGVVAFCRCIFCDAFLPVGLMPDESFCKFCREFRRMDYEERGNTGKKQRGKRRAGFV